MIVTARAAFHAGQAAGVPLYRCVPSVGQPAAGTPPAAAQVAQLVEQRIENPRVGGSNPPLGTIYPRIVQMRCRFGSSRQEPRRAGVIAAASRAVLTGM